MPAALPNPTDCCNTCDEAATTLVPGAQGNAGSDGTNGTNGVNAYTTLTAGFTQPAVDATVSATVADGSWITVGQTLFVYTAGYMQVTAKATNTLTLKNLGYTGNAAPAASIPNGGQVSPAGPCGAAGSLTGSAGGQLKGTYPNPLLDVGTVKGDMLVGDGTDVSNIAVGTNGKRIVADSAQALGVKWDKVNLNSTSEVNGTLAVGNGGTGGTTQAGARSGIGAAAAGANSDITSISALSTPLSVAQGGTGSANASGARTNLGITAMQGAALFQDQVASGIEGGAFTAGDWRKRPLSTEVFNTLGVGAILASSQITLLAGTYRVRATAPAFLVNRHKLRLRDVSSPATLVYGIVAYAPAAYNVGHTYAYLEGRFTLIGTRTLELQHYCETTPGSGGNGMGQACGFGEDEVYAQILIEKES